MLDNDPHFVFRLGAFRHGFIHVALSGDLDFDLAFYVDVGYGFHAGGVLRPARSENNEYLIDLSTFPKARRVRIDPIQALGDFGLRVRWRLFAPRFKAALPRPVIVRGDESALGEPPSWALNAPLFNKKVAALFDAAVSAGALADASGPLLSFVCPVFNTPPAYLRALVGSFLAQSANNWELLLCDDASTRRDTRAALYVAAKADARIRVLRAQVNGGIARASDLGVKAARGAWIGFVDHDDALSPHAVRAVNASLVRWPDARFMYTDEVIADAALKPVAFHFKPAFDPVLLSGVNYINHLSIYREDVIRAAGGLRAGFEGSQDYELLLRALRDVQEADIVHVPYPAYIWRRDGRSFSAVHLDRAVAAARRALAVNAPGPDGAAPVEPALDPHLHRLRYDLARRRDWPRVSVVIPNKDSFDLISSVLRDLFEKTRYEVIEVIVVDNGSTDERTLGLYRALERERGPAFRAVIEPGPFNFARQTNTGLALARGDALLWCNNDLEITDPDWLTEMVSCLDYPKAGVVGARLLYPDQTIQHAGVIVGAGKLAGHWHHRVPKTAKGPMGRLAVRQSFSAVTGACMLVSRACHEAVGRLDETHFPIAFNDVDYCLRAGEAGFRCVWTPFATLVHHESASRGSDQTGKNAERFAREGDALRRLHGVATFVDPAYSPWWSLGYSDPRRILPEAPPPPRIWSIGGARRSDAPSDGEI